MSKEFTDKVKQQKGDDKKIDFLYHDLLNRVAEEEGVRFFRGRIGNIPDSINVFFDSDEMMKLIYYKTNFSEPKSCDPFEHAKQVFYAKGKIPFFKEMEKVLKTANPPPEAFECAASNCELPADQLKWINKGIIRWTDDPLLRRSRAILNLKSKDYAQALEDIDKSIKGWPADTSSHQVRLECLAELRRYEEAVLECDYWRVENKDMPRLKRLQLVGVRMKKHQYDNAFEILQIASKHGLTGPDVSGYRGECLWHMERHDAAIKELTYAIENAKNKADASNSLYQRARCYIAKGNVKKAIVDLDHVLRLNPTPAYYRARAKANFSLKNYEACLPDLAMAIEMEPGSAQNYIERGRVQLTLKQPKKALADLNKAVTLNDKIADAYLLRAEAYRKLNQIGPAHRDEARSREVGKDWEDTFTAQF